MDLAIWRTMVAQTGAELLARFVAYLPSVLSATVLVLPGWGVAWLARGLTARTLDAVLRLVQRQRGVGRAVERTGFVAGFTRVFTGVVYWLVLVLFVAAGIEQLDLQLAAGLMATLAGYLPQVLVAVVIVFASLSGGQLAHTVIAATADAAGVDEAHLLGRATQVLIGALGFAGLATVFSGLLRALTSARPARERPRVAPLEDDADEELSDAGGVVSVA
jgi:hypothetical protein